MLYVYTVALFGHRYIADPFHLEARLEELVHRILSEQPYVDFLVGENGDFDRYASSVIHRLRQKQQKSICDHTLVLPYLTAKYLNNREYYEKYYSDVIVSEQAASAHPKAAITLRNYEMVDRADLIICYVEYESGGAWKAVDYALRQNKKVINLAEKSTYKKELV